MNKFNFLAVFLASVCFTNAQPPLKPEMILVKGGTFIMGSNDGDLDEKPAHSVTLNSFMIGKCEVTVAQYKAYCIATGCQMPITPGWGWEDNHPIVSVNYFDATAYCNWLSEKGGGRYRLPTEAEWEYAARGGNMSKGYTYSGGNNLDEVGWHARNASYQVNGVGHKNPNELGLFDMSGNVVEWCQDWYGAYYSNSQKPLLGPVQGLDRVVRGGCYFCNVSDCRVTFRRGYEPDYRRHHIGFRVVSSLLPSTNRE